MRNKRPPPQTLTIPMEEAAAMLGVSVECARYAAKKGQIETIRIGRLEKVLRGPLMKKLGGEASDAG